MNRTYLLLAVVCLVGCSRDIERSAVSGVVTLDGKPLPEVMVVFMPDPSSGTPGQRSMAYTDADGRYTVQTDRDEAGASVGTHRVSLFDPRVLDDKDPKPSRIPAKYSDALRTPLQPVQVGRGSQTYDIDLKSN